MSDNIDLEVENILKLLKKRDELDEVFVLSLADMKVIVDLIFRDMDEILDVEKAKFQVLETAHYWELKKKYGVKK